MSGCLGMDKGLERGIMSRHKFTIEGDGYVLFLTVEIFHGGKQLKNDHIYINDIYNYIYKL